MSCIRTRLGMRPFSSLMCMSDRVHLRAYKLHLFDTTTGLKSLPLPVCTLLSSLSTPSHTLPCSPITHALLSQYFLIFSLQVCSHHRCQRARFARELEIHTQRVRDLQSNNNMHALIILSQHLHRACVQESLPGSSRTLCPCKRYVS